jgi:hypothetical protein
MTSDHVPEINEVAETTAAPRTALRYVVTREGDTMRIVGTANTVVGARKLLRTLDIGTYSIISVNELDVPVRAPERIVARVVGKGTTFGKPRGPRDPSKPRKPRAAKAAHSNGKGK